MRLSYGWQAKCEGCLSQPIFENPKFVAVHSSRAGTVRCHGFSAKIRRIPHRTGCLLALLQFALQPAPARATGGHRTFVFAREFVRRDGKPARARMTFFNLEDGRVRQFVEHSTDEGRTWTPQIDLTYTRTR